jgi:oligo-1,6-glucosidase/alpha-glucosidase
MSRLPEDWWKDSVVYQIYPRSFQDTNGDGIGDLKGVLERLPYLAHLGIDVIWLCPMFASPNDDNGYDISDYRAIAPEFGTLADMDELIAAADRHGIKIVLDLVVNHTSDEHPWFVESRSSRTNPKRHWYLWKPAEEGRPPTDWPSFFGGNVWEFDPLTNEYYLHTFSKKQPDLNWENPAVREAVYDLGGWWIDRGVAGFRIDAITYIKKDLTWPRTMPSAPWVPCNHPGILEYLGELSQRVFRPRGMMTVAEAPGIPPQGLVPYIGQKDGVFSMVFTFEHVDIDARSGQPLHFGSWTLREWKEASAVWQRAVNEDGWLGVYLENHDQVRSVSKFGDAGAFREASAKALATWYFLLRGTPFVYQGQELGLTNTKFAGIDEYRDVSAKAVHKAAKEAGASEDEILTYLGQRSRDHSRTPMPWTNSARAGFTTGEPWIKLNPDHLAINVEGQLADPHSVLNHYRALISLRKSEPALVHGVFEDLWPDHERLAAYRRRTAERTLTVVCNLASEPVTLPERLASQVLLNTAAKFDGLVLDPWQAVVLRD